MTTVHIDKYPVGDDHPPIFLPDIGTFFNQDMRLAKRLVREVKKAGAAILKGEIIHKADICLNDPAMEKYYSKKTGIVEERYRDLIQRKIVSFKQYEKLFGMCKELEMPFVLSVYDFEGADFACDIGACALKIASQNIVHAPLIRYVSSLGLPVIIDTGKSTLEEIARAVQWAQDAGSKNIIVEHSPAAPPAPLEHHHLRMMLSLKQIFNCPIGLSDHHSGEEMLYAATAMGAHILEKGICPDNAKIDQDVYHALPIEKLPEVITKCNNIHTALGNSLRYLPRERAKAIERMGLITKGPVSQGDRLSLTTVDFAFPAKGIPVEYWDVVCKWQFVTALPKNKSIDWIHVRPVSS